MKLELNMETQNLNTENAGTEMESYPVDTYDLKKHIGEAFTPQFIEKYNLQNLKEKIQACVNKSFDEKGKSLVISFCSEKGGAGKTTTALCVGQLLANLGFSVLIADVDPNLGSSAVLEARIQSINSTIAEADSQQVPLDEVIAYKKGLEPIVETLVVKQHLFNASVVLDLASKKSYDIVLFDTAGVKLEEHGNFDIRLLSSSGKPHITTAYTSNFILIPTTTSNLDLSKMIAYTQPLIVFLGTLVALKKSIVNTQYRILPNRVEAKGGGLKELNEAQEELPFNWFAARVRRSEKIPANTSVRHGNTIYTTNVAPQAIHSHIEIVDQMFDDIAVSLEG